MREAGDEIIGKRVRIVMCQARKHGDNSGCLCDLIGKVVLIGKKRESAFIGTPTYYIQASDKRVRRVEVTLLRNQKTATEFSQPPLGQKVFFSSVAHGVGPRSKNIYATVLEADTGELSMMATLDECLEKIDQRGWVIVERPAKFASLEQV